ncbi:MAG: hypothetical protein QOD75_3814 [Blastocatellia bacterium]|jgi:hypothetical protein|nr:hypothetical protein [Blastocatellia bacterium]
MVARGNNTVKPLPWYMRTVTERNEGRRVRFSLISVQVRPPAQGLALGRTGT